MMCGATPFFARDVTPPACIDWPPTSFLKKRCSHLIKNNLVRTIPSLFSYRGDDSGKNPSHEAKYLVNRDTRLHLKGF
jgi:hypothetical protein